VKRAVKRALDTNVLIYAHLPAMAQHTGVRRAVLEQLRNPDVISVVTPLILHEFVHVVTDERRFDPPVGMAEALAVSRLYLEHSNVECVPTDAAAVALALELMERHRLGCKRVADSLIAASLLNAGTFEILTCNAAHFAVFEGLHAVDPRRLARSHSQKRRHKA
jgi:predicted nucleic acid-binding protein